MHTTMKRRILPLTMTALATVPFASALTSTPASAAATQAAKTRTFKGATAYVDHGPVQVTISVKGKKITAVRVSNSPEGGRSYQIQSQAIPVLRQETLQAQSANIQLVSGATDTSGGYVNSLQSAITKARKAKALK